MQHLAFMPELILRQTGEENLIYFRRVSGGIGKGLSFLHPTLMPDFWQFPTGSMGLGLLSAIYSPWGQNYIPQDVDQLAYYREDIKARFWKRV